MPGLSGLPHIRIQAFYESMTVKFCTCSHVAMALNYYPASTKVTVTDIYRGRPGPVGKSRAGNLVVSRVDMRPMQYLPRPADWGKHVKPIAESLFVTHLPKVGEAAIICLEDLRKRKKDAEKVLEKVKANSSYGVETYAKAGRRRKLRLRQRKQ